MDNQTVQQIKHKAVFFSGSIEQNALGHIFAEIYKDRVYAPFIEGRKDLTILDVGAHVGIFSIYAHPFAKKIYSIEPSTEHFMALQQNIIVNELTKVEAIQTAIGNENKKIEFFNNPNNKTMNSIRPASWQEGWGKEEVNMITLKKLFEDNKIKHVDVMKIDVEGMEYEILGGTAFSEISKKIDLIAGEIHTWVGRHPHQVIDSLQNNGYEVSQMPADANIFVARRN